MIKVWLRRLYDHHRHDEFSASTYHAVALRLFAPPMKPSARLTLGCFERRCKEIYQALTRNERLLANKGNG